jgi:PAS domain S-box-containing protein
VRPEASASTHRRRRPIGAARLRLVRSLALSLLGALVLVWAVAAELRGAGAGPARALHLALLCLASAAFALSAHSAWRARRLDEEQERDTPLYELEAVLAHAPIGLVFHDREGRHLRLNEPLRALLGQPLESVIGKTMAEVAPECAAEVNRWIAHVFETGEVVRDIQVTGPLPAYPGEIRERSLSFFPVRDPAGVIRCVGGIAVDVTERKRTEASLNASEARLRRLWESDILGVMYSDPEGRVLEANGAVLRMLGYTAEDARAGRMRWADFSAPEYRALDQKGQAECAARGACTPYEVVHIAKDGRRVPVLLGYAALPGPGPSYIAFALDQTERALLLESERAARAEAERASRLKDEFVATVSHELRTPLNAVLGWAQLLQRAVADPRAGAPDPALEKVEKGLPVIERNARQLAQIVSDLLDVSRFASGKVELGLGPVDLRAVVDAALEGVRGAAQEKGVALHTGGAPHGTLMLLADACRIQQVVANLASNAVKFTPGGGRVELVAERRGGRAVLEVRDTGEGLDPDFLPHVFDRFRQASGSAARRHGGLGLGLSIVKHVVDMHGGSVRASSAGKGRGATFTVELPLAAANLSLDEAERAPPATALAGAPRSLAGRTVLVVEDEPDARELARRVLDERGAVVVPASSALEALEILACRRPDVVVSDVGLPGMDGIEMIRQIRAGHVASARDVPVVALTAFARAEDRERMLAAGFSAHLGKPFDADALVALVAGLASTHRDHDGGAREPPQTPRSFVLTAGPDQYPGPVRSEDGSGRM